MISFEVENVSFPKLDLIRVKKWLEAVALSHGKTVRKINYLFCNDEEILKVNREFLKHDYYTDIITFDYSRGDKISGDIVISVDTVRDNAEEFHIEFINELLRVIVHGVLHLCGIDDKGPGEREIMEENENRALALWEKDFKNEV